MVKLGNASRLCSVQDCEKSAVRRGWCRAHYTRWQRHGDPLAGRVGHGKPLEFIETILQSSGDAACVVWPFSRSEDGYGKVRHGGRMKYAHRLICEMVNGVAPGFEMEAAHSCGNGHLGCVNPHHLAWETRLENQRDKGAHGTNNKGNRTLTASDAAEIRDMRGELPPYQIGELFGVRGSTVKQIFAGKIWA